jgi:hypothetical protein
VRSNRVSGFQIVDKVLGLKRRSDKGTHKPDGALTLQFFSARVREQKQTKRRARIRSKDRPYALPYDHFMHSAHRDWLSFS